MRILPITLIGIFFIGCSNTEQANYLHESEITESTTSEAAREEFIVKPIDTLAYEGWKKHNIDNVGFIYTPNDYEFINEEAYDKFSKELQPNAISQGVIIEKSESDTDFIRIAITYKVGSPGTVHKLSNSEYEFKPITLNDYETIAKPQLIRGAEAIGSTVTESTPVEYHKLNGMFCAGFTFKSISPELNDTLNSTKYWINDDDRIHHFSIAYTSNYFNNHQEEVEKIIDSFRITNIR